MPEPINGQHFAGPHPSCRELVAQLAAWGFTQRKQERMHTVFRGPHGGTLRVIRSQLGRANPDVADKAARIAGVTPAQFWAGPQHEAVPEAPQQQADLPAPQDTVRTGRACRRKSAARDSVIARVLAIHAAVDRPLSFDQVVELSGNRVTRDQVSAASAVLCRDGQLDRIRPGVYQWAGGQRATLWQIPAARRPAETLSRQAPLPPEPGNPSARPPGHAAAAELFGQLFPSGVQMTAELFTDLEQWARLTSRLAAGGGAPAL